MSVRLVASAKKELKEVLIKEAFEKGLSLSAYINLIISERKK